MLPSRSNAGVTFNVYETHTFPVEIIDQIISFVLIEYYQNNKDLNLKLNFYTQSHADRSYGFFGLGADKPIMTLDLKQLNNKENK